MNPIGTDIQSLRESVLGAIEETSQTTQTSESENNSNNSETKEIISPFSIKDFIKNIALFVIIYFIFSLQPTKNLFSHIIYGLIPDQNNTISWIGVVCYGFIIGIIYLLLQHVIEKI